MKGMSRRVTPLGWTVHRVHYSADPDKDPSTPQGKIWYDNARKGVRERDFRKEYEIDYAALGGQLVFPEFDEALHVIEHYQIEELYDSEGGLTNGQWTNWLCCDPHPRRAHAFVWLCVSKFGDFVIPFSWWPEQQNQEREDGGQSRLLIREYAERLKVIHKSESFFPAPGRMLMDPAGKNFNADEERNFFDGYRDEGIYFQPATKNREYVGYDKISKVLTPTKVSMGTGREEIKPRLKIVRRGNEALIQQIKKLRFREHRGVVVDKDPPSDPMDKERHLVDCVSYILLDDPKYIDRTNGLHPYTPIYPALGY